MSNKEKCPRCGGRGFYAAIGMYWVFRCDCCGYRNGNTPDIMEKKEKKNESTRTLDN